jgi:hypothetical protein
MAAYFALCAIPDTTKCLKFNIRAWLAIPSWIHDGVPPVRVSTDRESK